MAGLLPKNVRALLVADTVAELQSKFCNNIYLMHKESALQLLDCSAAKSALNHENVMMITFILLDGEALRLYYMIFPDGRLILLQFNRPMEFSFYELRELGVMLTYKGILRKIYDAYSDINLERMKKWIGGASLCPIELKKNEQLGMTYCMLKKLEGYDVNDRFFHTDEIVVYVYFWHGVVTYITNYLSIVSIQDDGKIINGLVSEKSQRLTHDQVVVLQESFTPIISYTARIHEIKNLHKITMDILNQARDKIRSMGDGLHS